MDFKYKDVEGYADEHIDVCLFNGAIRNSENEHLAHLLRQKTKVLVAFGSCATMGGIPGLANVADAAEINERVYRTRRRPTTRTGCSRRSTTRCPRASSSSRRSTTR